MSTKYSKSLTTHLTKMLKIEFMHTLKAINIHYLHHYYATICINMPIRLTPKGDTTPKEFHPHKPGVYSTLMWKTNRTCVEETRHKCGTNHTLK